MDVLNEYIVVMVMALCFAVGYLIKHTLDFLPNKYIPLIMGTLGVFLNVWINTWVFNPQVLLGGLASGLASTGAYEIKKNLFGAKGKVTETDLD